MSISKSSIGKYHIRRFTLLELMIAVMIFLIVSVIIAVVFRTTLLSYKKGNAYTELYQGLAGTFMVMENDLKRIVPSGDKDNVKFEPDFFSFIATDKDDNGYSALELIKYNIDKGLNQLTRNSVKYPSDKGKIDQDPVIFLKPIDETFFSYIYTKTESDTGTGADTKKKSDNSNSSSETDTGSKSDTEEKNIKLPFAVGIQGKIKSDNIVRKFTTKMFVSIYIADKSAKSDSDTASDTQSNSNSNTSNSG